MIPELEQVLRELGYEPNSNQHVQRTAARWASWLQEYANGTEDQAATILQPIWEEEYNELLIVKNIEFVSMCAHHILPFRGVAHVGYIPAGRLVGLSKLARVVDYYAKRLTIQERLTAQVADAVYCVLSPQGVMVVIEAEHQCMSCRGVRKPSASTSTSAVRGIFRDNMNGCKDEFLQLIRR